jgi:hypothetical protein
LDILTLIHDARRAGLVLIPEGDRLQVRGPRSAERFALRLREVKDQVLAFLRRECEVGVSTVSFLRPDCPLASFLWEEGVLPPGLREPEPLHGVFHKRPGCTSRLSWKHVWGEFYCLNCWPPTDPLAVVGSIPVNS